MWSAKINASTAKYEAPDEVDPVVTLSGIGLATAGRFLVEGALVVVCGRAQKTVAEARAILEDVGKGTRFGAGRRCRAYAPG